MFWKKKKRGSVNITPCCSMRSVELTPEEDSIVSKISEKLTYYQNKMCAYGDMKDKHIKRLQQVSATWDIDSGLISLLAHGSGFFSWDGTLGEFLGNNNLLTLPKE